MFNSNGDNFTDAHFKTSFARTSYINLKHLSGFTDALKAQDRLQKQRFLLCMRNTNFPSDLLKAGLAGITLIPEDNWWQIFLHINCLPMSRKSKKW